MKTSGKMGSINLYNVSVGIVREPIREKWLEMQFRSTVNRTKFP